MRLISWMSGLRLTEKLSRVALKQRLGTEDTATVVRQNRQRRYGHVLRKDGEELVKQEAQLMLTTGSTRC